jgi:hypothetical protein
MIDVSAPDDAVCNDCENFDPMEGVCMLDWTAQHPLTVACELFEEVEL